MKREERWHGIPDLPITSARRSEPLHLCWERLQRSRLLNGDSTEGLRDTLLRYASTKEVCVIPDHPRLLSRLQLVLVDDRRRVSAHRSGERGGGRIEPQRMPVSVEEQVPGIRRRSQDRTL